jgi:hypothetical protein
VRTERACRVFEQLIDGAEFPDLCETNTFVVSALSAAKSTQASHRRAILTDVAGLLSCGAEDLDFLFDGPVIAANDSDPVAMPDFRTTLMDERRAVIG